MRIDNLLYLIGGELKNSPNISGVSNIRLIAKEIKRGDIFFALNKSEIDEAVKNGAYGIVFEGWVQISDPEIAWIKVPSLTDAALKLLRFFLINERIPLHCTEKIAFDLAQECISDNSLLFCTGDPLKDLNAFLKREPVAMLLYDKSYLAKLALECEPLKSKEVILTTSYLFESSFLYDDRYYERTPIAPFLLPHLRTALALATTYNLSISLQHPLKKHFSPHFLSSSFTELEFGRSDRVLVFESDYSFAQEAKEYLLRSAPWAKTLFLSDKNLEGFTAVASIEELREILYNRAFNYALYVGQSLEIEALQRPKVQKTLF